ncbi:MAG: LamG domain-containing protein [Anaplasmataceae bacterium]|nr:LamG domain-containing protein [Anaplasmataceae bacterium]
MNPRRRSGFTLIELLIVIAIIAALAIVVVLVLNPAELVREARDSNRLQDLANINRALRLYELDVSGGYFGSSSVVYVSLPDSDPQCDNLGLPVIPGWQYACQPSSTYRNIDGTGWIPVDLTGVSFNPPLATLPVDPINTTSSGYYYSYIGGSWELNAVMESNKYQAKLTSDGGDDSTLLEMGSDLVLAPPRENSSSTVHVSSTSPTSITQGATGTIITVTGSDFVSGAAVSFSNTDITVTNTQFINSSTIQVTVDVKESITSGPGLRSVTVTNPDLSSDTGSNILSVSYNPSLRGYWLMNEGSGSTTTDATVNGNNGTLTSGPTWLSGGSCKEGGGCLGFNNSNNYVNVPHSTSLDIDSTPISISAWVYPTSTISSKNILIKNNQYVLVATSSHVRLLDNNTGAGMTGTTTLPLNQWTHIVGVISSNTTGTFYINGSQISSTWVLTWSPSSSAVASLKIPNNTSFPGRIDAVRVYRAALTATQVQDIYNAGN